MVDDWIKIDEVEITSEINCIHCDTRTLKMIDIMN